MPVNLQSIPTDDTLSTACEGPDCIGCQDCPDVSTGKTFWELNPGLTAWLNTNPMTDKTVSGADTETYLQHWMDYGPIPKSIPMPQNSAIRSNNPIAQVCDGGIDERIDYILPYLPTSMRCPLYGRKYKVRRCIVGNISRQPLSCGECPQCLEAWAWHKTIRYTEGTKRRKSQTIIVVDGLADDSEAASVRQYLGGRLRRRRFTILSRNPDTYLWRCVVVTADSLDGRDTRLAEYHMEQRYPHASVCFEDRRVYADELSRYLNGKTVTPNGHKPTQFSQDWITERPAVDTYQYDDGIVETLGSGAPRVTATKHACPSCNNIQARYPLDIRLAGSKVHINEELIAAANVSAMLDGQRMDYEALTTGIGEVLPGSDYPGGGIDRVIADLRAALEYKAESVSANNPHGMVLPHDARLALLIAYSHAFHAEAVLAG